MEHRAIAPQNLFIGHSSLISMKKSVIWTGVVLFILGVILFFLAGSTSGPAIIPFLNQTWWMGLAIVGIIVLIIGAVLKSKPKAKAEKKKRAKKRR